MIVGIVIQDPSFNRTSYIAYETLSDALMETQIHMKIKPTSVEDALLFYSAFSEDGNGDYIAITIKDRHVEFRYDSGSGELDIVYIDSSISLYFLYLYR